jgi:hypothetical protein
LSWEAIGTISEAIAAIAVLITLVFLTYQLRQNTTSVRMGTRARVTETISNVHGAVHDPAFAEIMLKGNPGLENLSDAERLQFASYHTRLLRVWEDAYFQWTHGHYDAGAWRANRANMLDLLSLPGVRQSFDGRRHWFDERFVAYLTKELETYVPPAPFVGSVRSFLMASESKAED